MLPLIALGALLASLHVQATSYRRVDSFSGQSFFDGFTYPAETYDNTTNGDVFWATASNTSLLYLNNDNHIILKVDNTSSVPYNSKRYAPKLLSKSAYVIGTVWVLDAVHMPYGCGVWPGFWTQGLDWPNGGEIDISEGVNKRTNNMIALHTGNGCTVTGGSSMSGSVTFDNCDNSLNGGLGCTINDTDSKSYGEGFEAAGGGVYIAEWAKDGIRVWFKTRSDVPSSLTVSADSIDTSSLGTPVAEVSSDSCDIETLFSSQTLTIDITLCGDFAGTPSELALTCPALSGDATCYSKYVINDQSVNLAAAYYEINYINVFSSSGSAGQSGGKVTGTVTATAGVGTGTGSSGENASSRGEGRWAAAGGLIGLVGMLLAFGAADF
ncbi:hypothetical protein I350_03328 [Cryptococcus amylolentus CBS 6273]|uniref:GH16 domain-containing protein n=1 Tax=Cryptococcus amylolentus CBS 6273 TaxID=1296118 RepID=A0A1E3K3P8_9TREE|nr:hypothetical protein I350_03328 [Cryptococcus amylolentus CBS 6273]